MARVRRLLANLCEGWFQLHRRFPPGLLDEIASAVADGERTHLGEVRLAVESRLSPLAVLAGMDAPMRARQLFAQLGIWDTEHNNGVLLYVLLAEHRIEVVADRGIARHVVPDEWRPSAPTCVKPTRVANGTKAACAASKQCMRCLNVTSLPMARHGRTSCRTGRSCCSDHRAPATPRILRVMSRECAPLFLRGHKKTAGKPGGFLEMIRVLPVSIPRGINSHR